MQVQVQVRGYQVDIEPQNLAAATKFHAFAEIKPKKCSGSTTSRKKFDCESVRTEL